MSAPSNHFFCRQIKQCARQDGGAAAIEFALLTFPFLLLVFAVFETLIAFAAEEVLANGVAALSRKIRTGEITFALGRPTDMDQTRFRQALCNEIIVMMTCSTDEAGTPDRLLVDVQTFSSFANMPKAIPRLSDRPTSDLDISGFGFAPGGAGSLNMVRAYYRWHIISDFMRPYLTNIRPEGQLTPTDYLIIATQTIQNEDYQ